MNLDGKAARGRRRLQMLRMKGRARRYAAVDRMPEENFLRRVDNFQVCSCQCCGNRRPYEGPGMGERRALDSMRQAIDEAGDP